MKNLDNYIIERLHITKDSKIIDIKKVTDQIIDWFRLLSVDIYEKSKIRNAIYDWVEANNVSIEDLQPCADKETLNEYLLNDDEMKVYNSSNLQNELCQYELAKAKEIYNDKIEGISIEYTNKMICYIGAFGTIYVVIKNKL